MAEMVFGNNKLALKIMEERFWGGIKKESYVFQMLPEDEAVKFWQGVRKSIQLELNNIADSQLKDAAKTLGFLLTKTAGQGKEGNAEDESNLFTCMS
jgi:hypothetical protein